MLTRAIELAKAHGETVMVTYGDPNGRWVKPRHLKLREDADGPYVRTGKRATVKKYLRDMRAARIVSAEHNLVTFYE